MTVSYFKRLKLNHKIVNIFMLFMLIGAGEASPVFYSDDLCQKEGYRCHKVSRQDSWASLFKRPAKRELIKKINRMNDFLKPGMLLAIPNDFESDSVIKYSPFPVRTKTRGEPFLLINKQTQAWAAYSKPGIQLRWGPVSMGRRYCNVLLQDCQTPNGEFRARYKGGKNCYSRSYPKLLDRRSGGAAMPYCINFHKGYFIHTGASLPGYPSTHGCVNLFWEDAKWLHEVFVKVETTKQKGTLIIIQ